MFSGLSASAQKKAAEELNEKPERREQDIDILRKLVVGNKALTCRTDAPFLLRFLRARKFNCEKANQMLINYFTIREEYKDLFANLRPSTVKHVYETGTCFFLPHRDKEGRRILYFRTAKWNPKEFPFKDTMRADVMSLEKIVEEEETQVNGIVAIGNYENATMEIVRGIDRDFANVFTKIVQDAFPLRFKGVFVVNEPTIFSVIYALIRPFLSEKMVSRVTVIGTDLNKLHKIFDPAILPEELGGDLPHGDILSKEWAKKMLASEQTFVEMSKCKIVTPKAIMKGKTESSTGGGTMAGGAMVGGGTYRKLNID